MATEEKIAQLRLDIEELEKLEKISIRPKVRDSLLIQRKKFETELISLQSSLELRHSETAPTASAATAYTVKISNFGWDQSDNFVKVYVTLPKVGCLPPSNVECQFGTTSFSLLVRDLDGKNHEMNMRDLLDDVLGSESYFKLKEDMLVLFLKKSDRGKKWSELTKVEKKLKEEKEMKLNRSRKDEDPGGSLMNLMKDMYDQGDDEMKRTIMKAWAETQDKKKP